MSQKIPLYLSPEKKAILERRYQEDGSRSITTFIENAIEFYLDYLSANNAELFLPTSFSPTWTAGFSLKIAWHRCCSSRRWSWTWV